MTTTSRRPDPAIAPDAASVPVLPRRGEIVVALPRMRVRLSSILVAIVLAALVVLAITIEIGAGAYYIPIPDVIRVFFGGGDELVRTTVLDWRMPRALVGLGVGAALGAAGALTQSLARNPIASPDLLGISMGASAAAVAVLVTAPSGIVLAGVTFGLTWAAFAGGLGVALIVGVLSWRGGIDSMRLVLIGVGMNTLGAAVVSLVLVRADITQATDAVRWLTGSLEGRSWSDVGPLWITIAIATAMMAFAAFDFRVSHLGDSVSRALGVPVRSTMLLLWGSSVILTAATVAAAGPVGFVALAAPQLARMLFRSPTPPVIGGALVGAALVLGADLFARFVLTNSPVGIITAGLGAPFLLFLLIRTNRKVTV